MKLNLSFFEFEVQNSVDGNCSWIENWKAWMRVQEKLNSRLWKSLIKLNSSFLTEENSSWWKYLLKWGLIKSANENSKKAQFKTLQKLYKA